MVAIDSEPVFKTVLGSDWEKLGNVVQKHYFLRPFSDDYICVNGVMSEVNHSLLAKLLLPLGLLFGAIVPYRATNVPIEVHYNACKDNSNIYWDRVFKFSDSRHFHFKSHMVQVKDNEVIEFVRFGVGLRLRVTAEDGAMVFRDTGYLWRLFGLNIPFPGSWLLGHAYVEERPIDDEHFSMKMEITHPWFGTLFVYRGRFTLT